MRRGPLPRKGQHLDINAQDYADLLRLLADYRNGKLTGKLNSAPEVPNPMVHQCINLESVQHIEVGEVVGKVLPYEFADNEDLVRVQRILLEGDEPGADSLADFDYGIALTNMDPGGGVGWVAFGGVVSAQVAFFVDSDPDSLVYAKIAAGQQYIEATADSSAPFKILKRRNASGTVGTENCLVRFKSTPDPSFRLGLTNGAIPAGGFGGVSVYLAGNPPTDSGDDLNPVWLNWANEPDPIPVGTEVFIRNIDGVWMVVGKPCPGGSLNVGEQIPGPGPHNVFATSFVAAFA